MNLFELMIGIIIIVATLFSWSSQYLYDKYYASPKRLAEKDDMMAKLQEILDKDLKRSQDCCPRGSRRGGPAEA